MQKYVFIDTYILFYIKSQFKTYFLLRYDLMHDSTGKYFLAKIKNKKQK